MCSNARRDPCAHQCERTGPLPEVLSALAYVPYGQLGGVDSAIDVTHSAIAQTLHIGSSSSRATSECTLRSNSNAL